MGLRLTDGIDAAAFAERTGAELSTAVDAEALARLQRLGLVEATPERLRLTPAGQPLLNAVLAELNAGIE
jgi:coproporphyrinogen III oxidase-like Fe-S oxidoreductase